ncbi:MAG: hypothetical protein IJ828_05335 [Treponema sp.]|nr:hypothetical protein [Treponema sp.]
MSCFVVPVAEAVAVTIATKILERRERKTFVEEIGSVAVNKEPFSKKLKRLSSLLWGGSALLAFEHFWHGEIQPFFPFLTAVGNPADAEAMLHEMATVGVAMAAFVTAVWGVMSFVMARVQQTSKRDESSAMHASVPLL